MRKPLGTCLLEQGVITSEELAKAPRMQARQSVPLGENEQIDAAIARHYALPLAMAAGTRADTRQSCRNWSAKARTGPIIIALLLPPLFILFPRSLA